MRAWTLLAAALIFCNAGAAIAEDRPYEKYLKKKIESGEIKTRNGAPIAPMVGVEDVMSSDLKLPRTNKDATDFCIRAFAEARFRVVNGINTDIKIVRSIPKGLLDTELIRFIKEDYDKRMTGDPLFGVFPDKWETLTIEQNPAMWVNAEECRRNRERYPEKYFSLISESL